MAVWRMIEKIAFSTAKKGNSTYGVAKMVVYCSLNTLAELRRYWIISFVAAGIMELLESYL